VHAPVRDGQCVTCHDPHGSAQKSLLKTKFQDLCATCHPAVREWTTRTRVHSPVRQGDCTRCHNAHASDAEHLLVADEGKLCLTCHTVTAAFTAVHKGFDPATSKCSACHDPHASSEPKFLMANVHAPFESGDCNACHQASSATAGYPLKAGTLQTCAACHNEAAADVKRFSAHGAKEDKACEMCHNAHASDERSLLAAPQKRLCARCHDPFTSAKNATANPHLNNGCSSCHAPHGSAEPYYLTKAPLEMCSQCHSREHHVSHPMGEKATDPLTNKPLDCLSCHKLHGTEFDKLLLADPNRDLCVRCHAK
jgi:predicted CXXCH cytochrome family protein